jgi:hypothetical protein
MKKEIERRKGRGGRRRGRKRESKREREKDKGYLTTFVLIYQYESTG